jgi:hypothetical protein
LTLAAVKQFQVAKGWTPANQVGPLTRAALNALIGTTVDPTTPVVVVPTRPVSAALSFDNPAAGSLISSQATADVLHINFAGTGTVTSVTLARSGISTQNTLSSVYLYDGATRLTDGYSFNASGTLTMNGLNIAVSGSKVISVKVDTASDATTYASSIAIALTEYTANGTATTANVQGNTFSVVTGSAATAYMTTNTASSTADVNAGTTQYTMWSDTIQVNTRTIQLKGMNFKMIGSAPTNALANIRLFVDGVDSGVVATVAAIQGSNYAMFNFATPISLTTGTHTIDVRADIETGANRTIQLSVQQAADVVLYDPQVGVNLAIQSAASTAFVADSGTTVTILTGSSTLVVDSTFSGYTNVTAGQTNAVIGKYTVHGYGEDVKVNTLYVLPLIKSTTDTSASSGNDCVTDSSGAYTSGTCGLNNVTLYFNGSQVGTQQNWTSTQMQNATVMSFTLGSQMIIPAGQDSTLEVRADLQNASNLNYTDGTVVSTIKYNASYNNAQGQSSSEIIDFPTSDVGTSGLSISSGNLVVSKNTGYASTTVNPNTVGAKIGSYVLQNQSSSESVRLTSLNVVLYSTTDSTTMTTSTTPALTNFSALRTSDTTGSGSYPITPTGSNTFSVTDILAPGAQMTVDIFANTSSATSGSFRTQLTVASIGAVSNIVDAGTSTIGQTISLGQGTVATPTLVSASSTPAQYVASSVSSPAVSGSQATFQFVSTTAASTISELKFTVTGTDANPSQTVTRICVGTVCGSPAVSSGTQTVYLTGLNLAVPTGAGLTQNVLVDYAGVGSGGVIPGKTSTVTLTYVKYTSGTKTAAITPSVAAPTMTLVGSIPTVVVTNTSVTGLNGGGVENKIGEVTISASSKGSIKLNDLKFNVSSTNINNSSSLTFTGARIADGSTTITGTDCGQGTAGSATQTIFCEFGTSGNTFTTGTQTTNTESNSDFDGYTIAADTSKTFSLYATVTGTITTAGSQQSISTSLSAAGFNWDDTSYATYSSDGSAASPSDGTGLTGESIYNFPTGSYTIHN